MRVRKKRSWWGLGYMALLVACVGGCKGTADEAPAEAQAEAAEPAAEPTEPAAEPTEPAAEPAEPAADPAEPAAEPVEPAVEPVPPDAPVEAEPAAHDAASLESLLAEPATLARDLKLMCALAGQLTPTGSDEARTETLAAAMAEVELSEFGGRLPRLFAVSTLDARCMHLARAATDHADTQWSCPALCAMQARFGDDLLGDIEVPRSSADTVVAAELDAAVLFISQTALRDASSNALAPLDAGQLRDASTLDAALAGALGARDTLLVVADARTPWSTFLSVALAARKVGAARVGVVTAGEKPLQIEPDDLDKGRFRATGLNPAFDEAHEAVFDHPARVVWLELEPGQATAQMALMPEGIALFNAGEMLPPTPTCRGGARHLTVCNYGRSTRPVENYQWLELYNQTLALGSDGDALGLAVAPEVSLQVVVRALDVVRHRRQDEDGAAGPFDSAAELAATQVATVDGAPAPLRTTIALVEIENPPEPVVEAPPADEPVGVAEAIARLDDPASSDLFGSGAPDAVLGDKVIGRPKLKPGRPEVRGALDKKILRKVVNQHKRAIKACYALRLVEVPALQGKVTIGWTIGASGAVTSTRVTSNHAGDDALAQCLSELIATWQFPAPSDGGEVHVDYPFVFELGN